MQLGNLTVKFHHEYGTDPIEEELIASTGEKFTVLVGGKEGQTICKIYNGDTLLGTGSSVCHIGDKYNRALGRKKSFTRAVEKAYTSKRQRSLIWEIMKRVSPKTVSARL